MSKPILELTKLLKYFIQRVATACGSVGRVVSSETRESQFDSSHWHFYETTTTYPLISKEKTKFKNRDGAT